MGMSRMLVEPMQMSVDVCDLWHLGFGLIGRRLRPCYAYILACGINVWKDNPFMKVLSS